MRGLTVKALAGLLLAVALMGAYGCSSSHEPMAARGKKIVPREQARSRATDDVSSLKKELAELKAKVAAMEKAEFAPARRGYLEGLTSLKKKGAVKIGGDVKVDVIFRHRDDPLRLHSDIDEFWVIEKDPGVGLGHAYEGKSPFITGTPLFAHKSAERIILKRRLKKLKSEFKDIYLHASPVTGHLEKLNQSIRDLEARLAAAPYVAPTQGELRAVIEKKEIPLPLKHTDVKVKIEAFLATVSVTQQYHNPYQTKIEAVYVFPLPQNSAVTDFIMIIGKRRIRGIIREKEEARKIYAEAKRQGYRASLLTQERPNIFKQKIANIEPGKRIDVKITYFNPLHYRDGEYEFVFPLVVGPRFNPPSSTDGIGAVGRGSRGASGQKTEIQYLKPNERSGHDITVRVEIDAGVAIEKVYSRTHVVNVERSGPSRATVTLSPNDTVPNKDFVLRYKTAGNTLKLALMTHAAEDGNYFALLLQPPETIQALPRIPREMVFVLDCSGSMAGRPLAKAKEAMRRCLKKLGPDDTFQIIRFSDSTSSLGDKPIPATPGNVKRGLRYLEQLSSGGGTMMIEGIKTALDFPHDPTRFRIVSFMTDGYIGNEAEILAAVKQKVGQARIFSFGVGSSVNRYLLERMARLGRGAVAYVGLHGGAGDKVDRFYERVSRPALAKIKIDWGEVQVEDVYPQQIPDLFVGRPILIAGKFECEEPTEIRISGRMGKEEIAYTIPVNPDSLDTEHQGIRTVWARWKIADLAGQELSRPSVGLRHQITRTSLSYKLLCRYTAFLAVDSLKRTVGSKATAVNVPVPVPEGVKFETTVRE